MCEDRGLTDRLQINVTTTTHWDHHDFTFPKIQLSGILIYYFQCFFFYFIKIGFIENKFVFMFIKEQKKEKVALQRSASVEF
jgi:hypothetical protein